MSLFTEAARNAAMMAHAMKLSAKAMDQPLYCIAIQIQWTWPDTFWEDKFVVVMGGLL